MNIYSKINKSIADAAAKVMAETPAKVEDHKASPEPINQSLVDQVVAAGMQTRFDMTKKFMKEDGSSAGYGGGAVAAYSGGNPDRQGAVVPSSKPKFKYTMAVTKENVGLTSQDIVDHLKDYTKDHNWFVNTKMIGLPVAHRFLSPLAVQRHVTDAVGRMHSGSMAADGLNPDELNKTPGHGGGFTNRQKLDHIAPWPHPVAGAAQMPRTKEMTEGAVEKRLKKIERSSFKSNYAPETEFIKRTHNPGKIYHEEIGEIDEIVPPGQEKFVRDAMPSFINKYGKKGNAIVHAVAWKRYKLKEARNGMPLEGHPYHQKTNMELRHIINDAGEAAKAMRTHGTRSGDEAEKRYMDQVNDAATVLYYRSKGGHQVGYNFKENNDHHTHAAHFEDPTTGEWVGMELFTANDDKHAVEIAHELAKGHGKLSRVERHIPINETLNPSMGASKYIDDFVHSKDPKFKGKSKKERIKQALGAYYSAKRDKMDEADAKPDSEATKIGVAKNYRNGTKKLRDRLEATHGGKDWFEKIKKQHEFMNSTRVRFTASKPNKDVSHHDDDHDGDHVYDTHVPDSHDDSHYIGRTKKEPSAAVQAARAENQRRLDRARQMGTIRSVAGGVGSSGSVIDKKLNEPKKSSLGASPAEAEKEKLKKEKEKAASDKTEKLTGRITEAERMKRKYLGKMRGTTANGGRANMIDVEPKIHDGNKK